jgi:DNA invertase Pin-like site-specific DNA recombinase
LQFYSCICLLQKLSPTELGVASDGAGQHERPGPGRADCRAARGSCAKIYREKVTGAKSERQELRKLLRAIEPGDVLMVSRLDRLVRSMRDLLNILGTVSGAGFHSLKDAWADTTTPHGRLMLTILSGLAEFEREVIRARTGEGRKRAKARGVRFGRPPKLQHRHQRQEAPQRLAAGETQADIARRDHDRATAAGWRPPFRIGWRKRGCRGNGAGHATKSQPASGSITAQSSISG